VPVFLGKRDPDAVEMMELADCDSAMLYNTYRQFQYINAALSRSRAVYRRWLKPAMAERTRTYTLLDVGFGGGDIALKLARWAEGDGIDLRITGIDIDTRAAEYVRHLKWPDKVTFRLASTTDLVRQGDRYDFVVSNHLLHHLAPAEFGNLLEEVAQLTGRLALMVDLRRSDVAYATFGLFTLPLFRDSYIRADGLASLRRSYTHAELRSVAPPGWEVRRLFPFRQVLAYSHDGPQP
jgi:2-polyprenyl-3-methyl-5-hydroxy-6-metoxy-1,4-benzoquinol methylase